METLQSRPSSDDAVVSHYELVAPIVERLFGPIPLVWTPRRPYLLAPNVVDDARVHLHVSNNAVGRWTIMPYGYHPQTQRVATPVR